MTLTSACPLLNSFQKKSQAGASVFLFFHLHRPADLLGFKMGRTLNSGFSFSLPFQIPFVPDKTNNRKTVRGQMASSVLWCTGKTTLREMSVKLLVRAGHLEAEQVELR